MPFFSLTFLIFLCLVFAAVYLTRPQSRYLILLGASYLFYGWNNLEMLPVLLLATVITYIGGLVLIRHRTRFIYGLFFSLSILILLVFKYSNFVVQNIYNLFLWGNPSFEAAHSRPILDIITPVGLSFYIFQSTGYLGDVYRRGMPAERNFFRLAAFVSFFPTILSGPIQRSRDLLPQLKNPGPFSYDLAWKGTLIFIWGCFQKLAISGIFSEISDRILNNYLSYSGFAYLVAAICYSFYIYSDFSSYSDMAIGTAMILGFDLKQNFRNPYLALSIADFWNRWHISLNTWFIENLYIPLGGSRKGSGRKYLNIFLVFLVSGLWHGASWTFIVWGILNGMIRIVEELASPLRTSFCSLTGIRWDAPLCTALRRLLLFLIITATWMFFRMPTLASALHIIRNMFFFSPVSLLHIDLYAVFGRRMNIILLGCSVLLFSAVQFGRKEDGKLYELFQRIPKPVQYSLLAMTVGICIFKACAGTTTFDTQFIYFQF